MPEQSQFKATSSNQRKMVGVQVDTSTGWGRRFLIGVFKYKSQQPNWDVWTSPQSFSESQGLPKEIHFDGAIVYIADETQAKRISQLGIPIVNASFFDSEPWGIPNIPPDSAAPIELAFKFFRQRAYESYAYCGPVSVPHLKNFAEKFCDRIHGAGYRCQILDVSSPRLQEQLRELPTPTAILAWPRTVYQLLAACHSLCLRIPVDFPVLVQDDDEILNQLSSPPLSAIQVPAEQIGYEAAKLLDMQIHGEALPLNRKVPKPIAIVERQSTNSLAIRDEKIRLARDYILNHSHRPCSGADIAELCGISRRTLERKFRKYFGSSIATEIQAVRLQNAREMLLNTELPIADIAPKCGYSSTEYFIYTFRKLHKMTPGKFRKHNRSLIFNQEHHLTDFENGVHFNY